MIGASEAQSEDHRDSTLIRDRSSWLVGFIFAVAIAAYVGFRLPSLYSMTLYNIGFADGAWRRGIFGTLMNPIWESTGYRYGAMALVALSILGILIVVAGVAIWTARWDAQRLLIIAWFVSPAGAYFFHEVGYLDQFVYLLFFLAAFMLGRSPFLIVMLIMAGSVLVHEVTLFTTLPIMFLLALVRQVSLRSLALFLVPIGTGIVMFLAPLMTEDQVGATGARLQEVLPFEIRWDAVALFGRSLSGTWAMEFYSPWSGFQIVLPLALAATVSTSLITLWLARGIEVGRNHRRLWCAQVVAIGAVSLPFLLVFFGWDFYRWAFLGFVNFVLVAVIWFARLPSRPAMGAIGVALVPLAFLFHTPLEYFDGYSPRPLTPEMLERIQYSPHTEFLGFPDDRL